MPNPGDRDRPSGALGSDSGNRSEPSGVLGWIKWLWTTEKTSVAYVRDIGGSVFVVLLIGGILFGVSGVWPPMVAIESPSMEPHIQTGDLVFVMEEHRFSGDAAIMYNGESTGVVPYQVGKQTGYKTFGSYGDVIVYKPDGSDAATPIIHRARFWVNDSENWYDKANESFLGAADNCKELAYCPAPHAGFITKGDNNETNDLYDQVAGISEPVKPKWIIGTAEFRIPWLGYIRLGASAMGGVGTRLGISLAGAAVIGGTVLERKD
jgi:signal peptidase